jgi:hypothetical protein
MNTYQVTIKIYNTYVGDNGFIPHAFVTISGTHKQRGQVLP